MLVILAVICCGGALLFLIFAKEGKINEAINVCRKGLEFFGESADLHYNLGLFLRQTGQRNEAIKEFYQSKS
jgi:Tfp pilus assembly protein PilF